MSEYTPCSVFAAAMSKSKDIDDIEVQFQSEIKHQISNLMKIGFTRPDALNILLRKIAPEHRISQEEIKVAMNEYKITGEQAMHALIVRNEMNKLMSQGIDEVRAIEELVRRLQSSDATIREHVKRKPTTMPNNESEDKISSKRSKMNAMIMNASASSEKSLISSTKDTLRPTKRPGSKRPSKGKKPRR